jgi:hypothetical protein
MKGHNRLRVHAWIMALGVVVLIACHGIILYYVTVHTVLSVAVVSGMIILVAIKYALFQRRSR